jgi:hypothetical protein
MSKILFLEDKWVVNVFSYEEGGLGIVLTKKNDNAQIAADMYEDMVISAWEPGLDNDEMAIKDFAENEGALKALLKAQIVHEPHRFIYAEYPYGVAELAVVRLKKLPSNLLGKNAPKSKQNSQGVANSAGPAAK